MVSLCPLQEWNKFPQEPGSPASCLGPKQMSTTVPAEGPRPYLSSNPSLPHCRSYPPTAQLEHMISAVVDGEQLHGSQPSAGEGFRQQTYYSFLCVSVQVPKQVMRESEMLLFIFYFITQFATSHNSFVFPLSTDSAFVHGRPAQSGWDGGSRTVTLTHTKHERCV